jgi:CelD/BcsL family acetyltransferase involved in cellulose biosynthesis
MSDTTIRVVTEAKEFESLGEVWDRLSRNSGHDTSVYLTHEWLWTWWRHFGEGNKLNILLIERESQVIGIVPLMRTEYRLGLLRLRALETIGSVNYNCVGLAQSENREEVIAAFLAYMAEELANNGLVLRLTLVPEDSEFLALLRKNIPLFADNLAVQEKATTVAPYIALPATWDEYFRSLSGNRRWILRRRLRALEEAHVVDFQECTVDTLDARLNEFFDLHQKRWQSVNVRGVFADPKNKEFYRDIATQFLERGWLHFSCITVDGEMALAEYSFVYDRKFYAATAARDPRYSKYSLGHLHYVYLVKGAIERGLQEFDFLKGDEPYKFYWTKLTRRCMQITIIRRSRYSRLRLGFVSALLRLNELRQYGLMEMYYLRLIRKREERERKRMGLKTLR